MEKGKIDMVRKRERQRRVEKDEKKMRGGVLCKTNLKILGNINTIHTGCLNTMQLFFFFYSQTIRFISCFFY